MEKPRQWRAVMREEIRDYVKQYGILIPVSLAAALLCYGFLVFSGTIRIDTEELLNHPGSKLGWLTIGRFGLAFLKNLLGLATHSALKSGILFFLFFWLGGNLLTFGIYHFSGKRAYPYWIFLLLYGTSNIWSYQIYFSVQQAEAACAMFLLVAAAWLTVWACFAAKGAARVIGAAVSLPLLVLGFGAYQALAAYYIAVCLVFFLAWLENSERSGTDAGPGQERRAQNRKLLRGCAGILLLFVVAYVAYRVIADTWFMATADYMEGQLGWGRYPVTDCLKNVLRTVKNVLTGIGPRNFSFYAVGVLVTAALVLRRWRKTERTQRGLRFWLRILALLGLAVSPFLMTIYMGEMLVTRAQFALPVAAAFFGMYAADGISLRWCRRLCTVSVMLALAVQCGYNLRLAYTDVQRFDSDAGKTEQLVAMLCEENGGILPTQPVVFVGYQQAEMPEWCRRTEMYGWSFYEWDYSSAQPTGATHRIAGFVQAYTGNVLNETADEEQKRLAAELAGELSDFPADGCMAVTEDFIVVRLSETGEAPATDWW